MCPEFVLPRPESSRSGLFYTITKSGCVCEGSSCVSASVRGHNAWRGYRNGNPAGRSEQGFYNCFLQLDLLLSLCFRNAEKKNLCCFATENVCLALSLLAGGFFHRLCLSFLSMTGPGFSNQPKKMRVNPEKTPIFSLPKPTHVFQKQLELLNM